MKFPINYIVSGIVAFAMIVASVLYLIVIRSRSEEPEIRLPRIDDVPGEQWRNLAGMKVFFGHQSVGQNIVDGMMALAVEHGCVNLNMVETCDPTDFERPLFAHGRMGENGKPSSKIRHFKEITRSSIGEKADIAFFKFCYVDITRDSDPEKIFSEYQRAMDELVERYPDTEFLHVTAPLVSLPSKDEGAVKSFLKSLLGRGGGLLDDNLKRQRYNELLIDIYGDGQNVFDLALIESLGTDGRRCSRKKGRRDVYFLDPEFTYDGGHLDEEGRKLVAEQLLIFLARFASTGR